MVEDLLDAVTFDFWNTVMQEEPGSLRARRLELWAQAFAAHGVERDPRVVEAAHDAAHRTYEMRWRAGRQFVVEDAVASVLRELGPGISPAVIDALREGYSEAGRRATVTPCPGIGECLETLRAAGVRLGIVCDIGLTPSTVVRELLARESLLRLFDDMTFSDEVGHYKPAPEIFRHALDQLGTSSARRAAHVGDRRRTDVAGARRMGMQAVRYTGVFDDPADGEPDADIVVDDLRNLPAALRVLTPNR
jgi:FMN phosphatase YigB (HAD superfamily)